MIVTNSKHILLRYNFFKCLRHKLITSTENVKYISQYTVKDCRNSRRLELEYFEQYHQYPYVWLRDNCQCEKCFHNFSQSRIISWNNFPIDITPKNSQIIDKYLKVIWSDDHESSFDLNWLKSRSFSMKSRETYLSSTVKFPKKTWDKNDFFNILKKYDFNKIINSDIYLYKWLESLATYGVSIIENSSLNHLECRKLANRINFIKQTHYGEEFYVTSKKDTSNVAYLPTPLQLHTDLPYYEYNPGVILLHCIHQIQGAENQLTDCFHIVNILKETEKQHYDVLKNTLVNWIDIGQENNNKFHKIYRAPVICENSEGEVCRINYSVPQRDNHFSVDIDIAEKWYSSLYIFVQLIYKNSVQLEIKPGDILTLDNQRLVHGRLPYVDKIDKQRLLVGAYLDWDEIYSRLRVIKQTLCKEIM